MSSDWPSRTGRLVLDEVDSTNAEALRRAAELNAPTWIMAYGQSAARGRRGRPWSSGSRNFAASLLCRPDMPPERAALLSFVASLALYDALEELTAGAGVLALKWPNDVLLNGGKVAGILLESAGTGPSLAHMVVGIGVNLADAPASDEVEAHATRPTSVLAETGHLIAPASLLERLAVAFARREAELAGEGFAPLRDLWLSRATRLGEMITARTGDATCRGRFETVDLSGALVLDTAEGRRAIAAADVYF